MTLEEKMKIVINNYFEKECSVNTSIREAFEKGFRIGVKKGQSARPERIKGHWIKISPANIYECSECGKSVMTNDICAYDFCHGCGADMREVTT